MRIFPRPGIEKTHWNPHCRGFADSESFVTCTLLGSLSRWKVGAEGIGAFWSRNVTQLEKVNCMQSGGIYLAVAGFSSDSKGLVEVYGG